MANTAFEHSPTITVPGSGNSTDNAVVLWNGTTGNNFSNSLVIITSGAVTGVTTLAASTSITTPSVLLSGSSNTLTLDVAAVTAAYTIIFPDAVPGATGKVLKSSGGSPHAQLEWGDAPDTNTTYTTSWVDSSNDVILRLTPSSGSNDDLLLAAGTNITLTPSVDTLTITAAGGPSQASVTETKNQSNVDKYVPPDLMTNVPGVSRTASTGNITFASALGTTLTNLDNWSIAIEANEFVSISIVLYLSLTTDGDFKYAFTGPSGLQMHSQGILVARDTGAVVDASFESAPGTGVPIIANTNGEFVLRIDAGFMSDGTAGTIQFQYAQNTSDDSDEHLRRQSTFVASRSWH